jgi:sec-independent protein translocase protein TatC
MPTRRNNKNEMSFLEHLEDLRWHLIRSILVIAAFATFFLIKPEFIFDDIILAPKKPEFITYKLFCNAGEKLNVDALCVTNPDYELFYLNLSSPFFLYLKIAMMGGVILAFPYILWEVWRFVKPALYQNEINNLGGIIFIGTLLFYLGVMFGYFLLAPFSINFLATFNLSSEIQNQFTFDSYLGILTGMVLWTGIIFEIPMVAYFLAKIGVLGKQFMSKNRKYAFVISLILAAIITPSGDAFSLFLVAVPLLLLYEISILVVMRVERKRNKEIYGN